MLIIHDFTGHGPFINIAVIEVVPSEKVEVGDAE